MRLRKDPSLFSRTLSSYRNRKTCSKTHNREPCYLSDKGKEICIDHLNAFTVLMAILPKYYGHCFFVFWLKIKKCWRSWNFKVNLSESKAHSYSSRNTVLYFLERKRSFQILVVWDRGCSRNKAQWRVWGRKGRVPWGTSMQQCWWVVEQEAGTSSCGPEQCGFQWRAAEAALSAASGRPPENCD